MNGKEKCERKDEVGAAQNVPKRRADELQAKRRAFARLLARALAVDMGFLSRQAGSSSAVKKNKFS